jgi:hypothetical protein
MLWDLKLYFYLERFEHMLGKALEHLGLHPYPGINQLCNLGQSIGLD